MCCSPASHDDSSPPFRRSSVDEVGLGLLRESVGLYRDALLVDALPLHSSSLLVGRYLVDTLLVDTLLVDALLLDCSSASSPQFPVL
jgi:hypothetical protein